MIPPEILFQGARLRAGGTGLDRPRVLVTFDRRRADRRGFPDYQPAARVLGRGYGHLAVEVAQNDWFLNPETPQLEAALAGWAGGQMTCGVGFSMGGYGLLRFARALGLQRALLFAPQYSIFAGPAPWENRYDGYRHLASAEHDRITPPDHRLTGLTLFDPRLQPRDRQHAWRIAAAFPGLLPCALPFGGHPPLKLFDRRNGFGAILDAFLDGPVSHQQIRDLHRSARVRSDRYSGWMAKRGRPIAPAGA